RSGIAPLWGNAAAWLRSARERVADPQVLVVQHVGLDAAEAAMEGADDGGMAGAGVEFERVADEAQRQTRVEAFGRIRQRRLRPAAEAGVVKALPREVRARVALAHRRQVGVRDHLGGRDAQALSQVA